MPPLPTAATIREVGLRDGLQSIPRTLATERKMEWIQRSHAAGIREIEVGSFVPAKYLPQLADTAQLVAYARTLPGLSTSVLVPNLKGAQHALETQVDLMLVPLSASRAHSLANLRKPPEDVITDVRQMCAARDASGSRTLIEGGVGTAFGCTLQGFVDPADVLRYLDALLAAGVDRVSLADTVGYATPDAVRTLFRQARDLAGDRLWCGHFHNTRGLGLVNVYAAMEAGITRFDASLGGLGGCPYAPGATGNVSTEDLAFMLDAMQIQTGIDVPALLRLRGDLATWLPEETLHGHVWRAGLPKMTDDQIKDAT